MMIMNDEALLHACH